MQENIGNLSRIEENIILCMRKVAMDYGECDVDISESGTNEILMRYTVTDEGDD